MDSKAIDTLDIHANSIMATLYDHPSQVLADPILQTVQKRCILAAWASDAFAVEDKPWLRRLPGSSTLILLSQILDALQRLDDGGDPPPTGGAALPTPRQSFADPSWSPTPAWSLGSGPPVSIPHLVRTRAIMSQSRTDEIFDRRRRRRLCEPLGRSTVDLDSTLYF